jgi:hypothetical protein
MTAGTQVLAYRGTRNLGDAVQAVAVSRLLPRPLRGVWRDSMEHDKRTPLVVNGWIGYAAKGRPLFCGAHLGNDVARMVEWCRRSSAAGKPVGARDPHTAELLYRAGVSCETVGCATMTLPRHAGPRSGCLAVDETLGVPNGANAVTCLIPADMPWRQQWDAALSLLDRLRHAAVVHTTRLHAAVPCLAMGTPVIVRRDALDRVGGPERLSLLDRLGLEWGRPCVLDLSGHASAYLRFLYAGLGTSVVLHEPEFPVVMGC